MGGPTVRDVVHVRRIATSIRGPAGIALLAGSLAAALRLPFVHDVPYADEGGLLVVASHWHTGGPFLYGPLFVDRPPLLLGFFRLADALGGVVPLRWLGLVLVLASVALAARAGWLLGGRRGSVAASMVSAALLADPRLGTQEVDAETVGAPLVLVAAVFALEALGRASPRTRARLLVLSGLAASAALLVKQNLGDGLAFTVVLVVASAASRSGVRRAVAELCPLGLGAAVPVAAAAAWSVTGAGLRGLWYAVYGFRIAARTALFATSSATQTSRLDHLGESALTSGLVVVLGVAVAILLRHRDHGPASTALGAMLVVELVGVAGGGYYWPHYLVGLVPATSLLAARAAGVARQVRTIGVVVVATLLSTVVDVGVDAAHPTPYDHTEVGALATWLDRVDRPGDSAVVLYGDASLFEATRLRPAYPYLWTLPQRVLDPHLSRLVRTLDATRDPTFVVVRMPLDPWGQDPRGRVQQALDRHYRVAAHVAGDTIYRRDGSVRTPVPALARGDPASHPGTPVIGRAA